MMKYANDLRQPFSSVTSSGRAYNRETGVENEGVHLHSFRAL